MTSTLKELFRFLVRNKIAHSLRIFGITSSEVPHGPKSKRLADVTPTKTGSFWHRDCVGSQLQAAWCSRRCYSTHWLTRGLSGGRGGSQEQQTLQDVARFIRDQEYKRIVVMAGAGISTPSGIPDFRSPGSGLYDNLQQYDLPYAEAIFEINYFRHNPKPFFALAKELYPGNYLPNLTHFFIRLLHDKGLLHRMYTQNIDGLERMAGIPSSKLVEAHGTFATATCTVCRTSYPGEALRVGDVPRCSPSGMWLAWQWQIRLKG